MNKKYARKPKKKERKGYLVGFAAVALISGCIGYLLGSGGSASVSLPDKSEPDSLFAEEARMPAESGIFHHRTAGMTEKEAESLSVPEG